MTAPSERAAAPDSRLAVALAGFFTAIQFYTSLAALAPTPPVGYLFATRATAIVLIGIVIVTAAWAAVALVRARASLATPSRAMLGAWIGSAALSSLLGLDPGASLQVVGMMLVCAVFHLAVVRFYDRGAVAGALLGTYLVVGSLAALAAIVMVVVRRPAPLWALNHGRAAGVFVTANQCAAFAIAFVFVALGVALSRRGALAWIGWTGLAIGVVALAATFSQAGWIGAVAGAVFFAFALGRQRLAGGFVLVALAGGLVLGSRPAGGHNPADAFDRLRVWQAGVRVAELFPLTGVGPMAYWRVYPAIRPANGDLPGTFGALHPHDAYLSLAGETGLVGLVAFGYGWIRFGCAMRERLRRRPVAERYLALGVCAALVGVMVQGLFDTIGVVQLTFVWIPYSALALAAAGGGVARVREGAR